MEIAKLIGDAEAALEQEKTYGNTSDRQECRDQAAEALATAKEKAAAMEKELAETRKALLEALAAQAEPAKKK